MRLQQYDPPKPVSYLNLIDIVLHEYDGLRRPEDILKTVGANRLTDVTHTPEIEGEATVRLYDGGDQRIYQFKESASRGGTIDVLFNHGRLENFRARLFFSGVWGKAGAVVYSSLRYSRLMTGVVGRGNIRFDAATRQFFCHYGNLVIAYTHELDMGLPSISTSILAREGCYQGILSTANDSMHLSPV
ncbi:hypothetical protein ABFB09_01465 [Dehalogenimonas sp. THU2]|uniref:hypothetical protein n=1 Tax=Dehalogenimonas sp. THU2 TaxID=3151121 RepID=UPI003218C959